MDDVSEQALQAATDQYNAAVERYNNAAAKLDNLSQQQRPTDDGGASVYDHNLDVAQKDLEQARGQLGTSARAAADVRTRLATAYEANQRAAKDPNEQTLWANEAQKARAQADLYGAEAGMYTAKTQADIDNATARAQAALSRAQTYSQNSTSLNASRDAQAALAKAKLAVLPALSQSTIALHNQQIATAQAHSSLYVAQTARANAQADFLIPAQVDELVQRGILDAAKADQIKQLGPIKVDELASKVGLNQAKVDQIRAALQKWNVLPAADRSAPTLVEQQPFTGEVRGVENPGYVNPETQAIKDTYAAIDYVQSQLTNGQINAEDADSLMANLRSSLAARAKGFTPEQLVQNQNDQTRLGMEQDRLGLDKDRFGLDQSKFGLEANAQEFNQGVTGANVGKGILGGMQSQGDTMANSLIGAAGRARDPSAFEGMTPYTNAQDMGGGPDAMRQAFALMAQVKPITDRMSALDAVAKYGAASALLKAGGGGSGSGSDGGSRPGSAQEPNGPGNDFQTNEPGVRNSIVPPPSPPAGNNRPQPPTTGPGLDWLFNNPMSPIQNPANTPASDNSDSARLLSAARG